MYGLVFKDYIIEHPTHPNLLMEKINIKNAPGLLKLIRGTGVVSMNSYLVTLDVTSLYSNICIPIGIQVAQEACDKFRSQPGLKLSNKSLYLVTGNSSHKE